MDCHKLYEKQSVTESWGDWELSSHEEIHKINHVIKAVINYVINNVINNVIILSNKK